MGDRVAALHALVVAGRDYLPVGGEHGADRNAAGIEADPRLCRASVIMSWSPGAGEPYAMAVTLPRSADRI